MPVLSAEESIVLLTCRPDLGPDDIRALTRSAAAVRDWAYVLWRGEQYRMLPLMQYHLISSGTIQHVPEPIQIYIQRWVSLSRARSIEQMRQLALITRAFEQAQIEYFLLKGCGVATLYYHDPLLRPMQDLDLIVRPEDVERVQGLLFELGYEHGIWDSDSSSFTPIDVRLTRRHIEESIEIPPFTRFATTTSPVPRDQVLDHWRRQHIKCAVEPDGTLVIPVFIDIHTNLSASLDLEDVWHGWSYREVLGQAMRVQSATSMLWFIAARVYLEAFTYNTLKLSMLGDVHALLSHAAAEIDWAELVAIAFKYGMRPALFYVLARVMQLMGASVPLEVLAVLKPDPREKPLDNDWGDIIPKLLSRPDLQTYRYYGK